MSPMSLSYQLCHQFWIPSDVKCWQKVKIRLDNSTIVIKFHVIIQNNNQILHIQSYSRDMRPISILELNRITLSWRVLAIKLKIMIQSENISELSSNYAFSISINDPQRTLSKLIRYQTFSVSQTLRVSRQVFSFPNVENAWSFSKHLQLDCT